MATIPIEVIVQDGPSPEPTPTPSDPGETNIVVPDTGAGTINNAGNGGGIGSATNIILPAIILVLAIGAIAAIMVHRYQKRKKINDGIKEYDTKESKRTVSRKEKLATVASGTIAILAATVLVGNLVIPATSAATDDTSSSGSSSEEGTYLETEGKVSIVATIDKDSKEPTIVNVKDILYATTDASGYTVTMSMIEGALSSNLYLNGDTESEYYIASVEGEEGSTELVNNTWGYKLDEETDEYNTVPLADASVTIKESEAAVTHEEIDVYYGLMVDNTLPLGTYKGEIEYNITPVNPIDKLTYMQDFTTLTDEEKTRLLASMPEGEQYILKDIRDEKPYYISKLADGNVWMTQNLDHDIGDIEGGTYKPTDTDISADWTPSDSARTKQSSDTSWAGSTTVPQSSNPGVVYWNGVTLDDESICAEYGGIWKYGGCQGANPTASTGNAHYHIGNYYNWTAAVAMSDSGSYTAIDTDVDQSICPAGWMLPKGGATLTGSGSFIYLKNRASLTVGTNGNIHTRPNFFVYSGGWSGKYETLGYNGTYWSSVVNSSSASYSLGFSASGRLESQGDSGRYYGASIRCVVRN